jgi:uncharacterized protein YceH (UPF0502 family)
VFGCLLEKEMATPDYYPMTATAVIAACNQTTNRDPVVTFDEKTVEDALTGLRQKKLAAMIHLAGARVPKYKHLADEFFPGFDRPERAVLAVLLLRGAQTVAELRARTERLHAFPGPEAVEAVLSRLAGFQDGPLVAFIPSGGGRRAATWSQLLSVPPPAAPPPAAATVIPPPPNRIEAIESAVADLRRELADLRDRIARLESPPADPSASQT